MRRRRNRYLPSIAPAFRFDRIGTFKHMRGRRGGRPRALTPPPIRRAPMPSDPYAGYLEALLASKESSK